MEKKDIRLWYNIKTEEIVDCKYHYDCDLITKKIQKEGKLNFFRDGWCRIGVYLQNNKFIGIVEAYSEKNIKKGIDFLLSKYKIHTIITERNNSSSNEMNIFPNPLIKENMDGI